ncbi:unnamed protein product [Somion occarium]|uniref:NAD(P)-binding protein n=1 Tax=Somion occarium TaxID=3059160 RepID=A0ABP1DRS8_9APHY
MGSSASVLNPDNDLLDLHGKVAIVTGANAGIGYWTAAHLSKRGAKVYLACRNESRATGAITSIEAWNTSKDRGSLIYHHLSLDDPREAKKSAEEFLAKETRLDIVVNNAGLLASPYEKTKDGIVNTMVVNHLSPLVFTHTLSPLLEKTASEPESDVRIINVSSLMHSAIRAGQTKFDSIDSFNARYEGSWVPPENLKRYGLTKLANILWTNTLQKQYDAKNVPITCISMHPGGVLTDSALERLKQSAIPRLRIAISRLFADEPEQGSFTTLFAAASKEIAKDKGKYRAKYLAPYGKIVEPSKLAKDETLANNLWGTTQKVLKEIYGIEV